MHRRENLETISNKQLKNRINQLKTRAILTNLDADMKENEGNNETK